MGDECDEDEGGRVAVDLNIANKLAPEKVAQESQGEDDAAAPSRQSIRSGRKGGEEVFGQRKRRKERQSSRSQTQTLHTYSITFLTEILPR